MVIEQPSLYDHQVDMVDRLRKSIARHRASILQAPPGCHAAGQGIMLHSGRVVKVEDVAVGDVLMGPDSKPRRVLATGGGWGRMVRIVPTKGEPWIVNEDHILTIVMSGDKRNPGGQVVDVSVREWMGWSNTRKHHSKLFRVAVDFDNAREHALDPYLLGVVLGDGSLHNGSVCVTTADPEIVSYLEIIANEHGLILRAQPAGGLSQTHYLSRDRKARPKVSYAGLPDTKPGDAYGALTVTAEDERERSSGIAFRRFACRCQCGTKVSVRLQNLRSGNTQSCGCLQANPVVSMFRDCGLGEVTCGLKFIPHSFKVASRQNRLLLLAGLMDTDGSLSGTGFDFISKSKLLASDVAFVARSVGLAAYLKECENRDQNGKGGAYWRVSLSGDCSVIPCRIARKQAPMRLQKKDVCRTGFKVEPVGTGEYFGFTLDGDGRYLLDDFTVTHNTGKTRIAKWLLGAAANRMPVPTQTGKSLFAVHRRGLVDNASNSFNESPPLPHGILMSGVKHQADLPVQVASIDTLLSWFCESGAYTWDETFDLIVFDEAHSHHSKLQTFLLAHNKRREELGLCLPFVIGLTATPQAQGLADLYREIVRGPETQWLIDQGFLKSYRYFRATQGKLGLLVKKGDEYTKDSVGLAMEGLSGDLVRDWKKFAEGRATVGFFPRRTHAQEACEALCAAGVKAEYVDGDTDDDRRRMLYRFLNEGVIEYLCNVGVVERGTDIPRIGCVQMCTAVGNVVRWLQMIGRGSRVHPEVKDCLVIDHGGGIARHGFFEDSIPWTLDWSHRPSKDHMPRPKIECPRCCVARGTMILTDRGEVPIEEVQLSDRIWDGVEFCSHDGICCNGIKEVIRWGGVTLTPDHKVLTNDGWKEAEEAKAGEWRPVIGGVGWAPVRTIDDSNPYCSQERSKCRSRGRLRSMREKGLATVLQDFAAHPERLRALHDQVWEGLPGVACAEGQPAEVAMSMSGTSRLQKLRRSRNRVQVFVSGRRCEVDRSKSRATTQPIVDHRSNRQRRALRRRQSSLGHDTNASSQSRLSLEGSVPHEIPVRDLLRTSNNESSEAGANPKADCRPLARKVQRGILHSNVAIETEEGTSVCEIQQATAHLHAAERNDAETDRQSMAVEVWDIQNVGPRNRYTANGVIVSNCAVYRGGKCKICGYEPTARERKSQGLEFDGAELQEVKPRERSHAKEKQTCERILVEALYQAGRTDKTWKQALAIAYREAGRQGVQFKVPKRFEVGGRVYAPVPYGNLEHAARLVKELYDFV